MPNRTAKDQVLLYLGISREAIIAASAGFRRRFFLR